MNKAQAIQAFWESFGLPAYHEQAVPDDAKMPYITYNSVSSSLYGGEQRMQASIWYRNTSWEDAELKAEQIARYIEIEQERPVPLDDGGYLWIKKDLRFSERMTDEDDSIRRIYVYILVEFLTPF